MPTSRRRNSDISEFRFSYNDTPQFNICPEDGLLNPPIICSNVDFPHPDGPVTAINSPFSIAKEILVSALTGSFPTE